MFCTKCGQELSEQMNFCPKCGLDVRVNKSAFESRIPNNGGYPVKKEKDVFSIIGFILSIIVLVSAVVSIPSTFIHTKEPDSNILILILSFVFSIMGMKSKKKKLSVAGVIMATIAFVLVFIGYIYIIATRFVGTDLYNFFSNSLYY